MVNQRRISLAVLLLSLLPIFFGCGSNKLTGDLTQGEITYQITYPELDSNDLRLHMFPTEMKLQFKNDRYKTTLSGVGGIFQTSFISNATDQKLIQTVKVFSDKYAMKLGPDGVKELHKDYPKHSITFLDETDEVAAIPCNKVIINFGISRKESLFFLYSRDIKLQNPNWGTPFPQIDGVLLDYQIESYGTVMRLRASEIKQIQMEDSEFILPDDYEIMPMAEFLDKLQQNIDAFNQ